VRVRDSAPADPPTGGRRAIVAWCMFDWANSAFPTIVSTFLFSAYFTDHVAPSHEAGQTLWSLANGVAALVIAALSPLLGAIADQGGRRKPWLFALSLVSVAATAALWFVRPTVDDVLFALVMMGVATLGFELGIAFYNAMLPEIVAPDRIGRLSGWGWGIGYGGGLACLALSYFVFVAPDPPPFGLDREAAEHVRIVMPLAALWFALFALPLFLWVPDRGRPLGTDVRSSLELDPTLGRASRRGSRVSVLEAVLWFASSVLTRSLSALGGAVRGGVAELAATLRQVRRYGNIVRFLLAKMIYIDALNTLFIVGGTFAAGVFDMSVGEVLVFGIILNVTAGAGAIAFAWVDDWLGAKPTILLSLAALTLAGGAILATESKLWFYILAAGVGAFLGPAQAASRSLMARLAPPAQRTEFFGLYNLAGKITTPVGPFLVGLITYLSDSQRAGMAVILPFLVVGGLLLTRVKEPRPGHDPS
jgi:MFS transporter, UMF1 family